MGRNVSSESAQRARLRMYYRRLRAAINKQVREIIVGTRISATVGLHGVHPSGQQVFFCGHWVLLQELLRICELHTVKNADYTGGNESDDPLANFKDAQDFGIDPLLGLCLRMSDKFARVKTFARTGVLAVSGESVDDAFRDIAVYALLALALRREKNETNIYTIADDGTGVPPVAV